MSFIYTGSKKLSHDRKLETTKRIVGNAKTAHKYLPSIVGLGKFIEVFLAVMQNHSQTNM